MRNGLTEQSIEPAAAKPRLSQADMLTCGLLTLLTCGLYGVTVGFGFVNWDDPWYVVENPLIKSWSPANLWAIWTQVAIKNYAPVTLMSYLVEHSLWGLWPGGYHATNVVLHAINAALVYALVKQVTGDRFIGWGTAALFAVHPVHIESVAWVASRKGLLSGAFILASLIYSLRTERTPKDEGRALLFLALALLSKAIAIVVPPVVLAYDVLIRRKKFSDAVVSQIVPGFLAFCLLAITMSAQVTEYGGVREHMQLGKLHILGLDAMILWRYVGMLLWPTELCILYDPPTSGIARWIAVSVLDWSLVTWAAWRCRHRFPLVPFAAVTSLLFLLPVLNLFPITTLMNDRYLYLPSISLLALAVSGLRVIGSARQVAVPTEKVEQTFLSAGVAYAVVLTCLLLLCGQTWSRLPVWKNGLALWADTHRQVPQLAVVQIQRANLLHSLGRTEEALAVLRAALSHCRIDEADYDRIQRKLEDWSRGESVSLRKKLKPF